MGRRRLPPLTAGDIIRMLERDGWHQVPGGRHVNFKHSSKSGKVQVSAKWTGVKPGSLPWKGLLSQTGWARADVERLFFGD